MKELKRQLKKKKKKYAFPMPGGDQKKGKNTRKSSENGER